ncbi:MAG: hypothetical protein RIE32_13455 [Phycisphaerales bacterium]
MTEGIQELVRALGGDPTRWNHVEPSDLAAWFRGIARQMGTTLVRASAELGDTFSAGRFDLRGSTLYLLRLHGAPYTIWSTSSEVGKVEPCVAPIEACAIDYGPATLIDESLMRTRLPLAEWVELGCDRPSLLTWFHPNSRPSVAEVCFNNYA